MFRVVLSAHRYQRLPTKEPTRYWTSGPFTTLASARDVGSMPLGAPQQFSVFAYQDVTKTAMITNACFRTERRVSLHRLRGFVTKTATKKAKLL
jgi:hypothetical protein